MASRVTIIPKDPATGALDFESILEVEASISESHDLEVMVTKHPVEQGADVTDHVQPMPDALQIEGIVSNTPIRDDAFRRQLGPVRPGMRGLSGAAYAQLRQLAEGQLMRVVTTLRTYDDMLISKLNVPRNAELGEAVKFTISFTHLRTVSADVVTIQTKTTDGQPKVTLPKKTPTPLPQQDKGQSELSKLVETFIIPGL